MVLGFFLSFIVCGGFAFIISRLALSAGLDKDNRFLAGLFYFLAPFLALSVLSAVVVGLYSVMGFSLSAIAEILVAKVSGGASGLLVTFGSILTTILAITAFLAGPSTAFVAAKFSTIVAAVFLVFQRDPEFNRTWLPWVAFACYGFFMWPFTALLTFGL